jgi:hypothetical protein
MLLLGEVRVSDTHAETILRRALLLEPALAALMPTAGSA